MTVADTIIVKLRPRLGTTRADSEVDIDVTAALLALPLLDIKRLDQRETFGGAPKIMALVSDEALASASKVLEERGFERPFTYDVDALTRRVKALFGVPYTSYVTKEALEGARRARGLPIYRGKAITATYQPQRDVPNRHIVDDGPTVDFDVTQEVLQLDLDRIIELEDNTDESDEVIPLHRRNHPGPGYVDVQDSILAFFDVVVPDDITEEMLDEARAEFSVGEEREYEIVVQRVAVRETTMRVKATSEAAAREQAVDAAGDIDFPGESSAEYEIASLQVVEPPVEHERQRG